MCVFCDRLEFCSTAALDCHTRQNKGRYCKEELLFLLISLEEPARVGATSQRYGKPVRNKFSCIKGNLPEMYTRIIRIITFDCLSGFLATYVCI